METIISQYLLLLYIPLGIYVSHRICPETKFIFRLIMILPVITAVISLNEIIINQGSTQLLQLFREISSLITYTLLAFLLTGKRILRNIDYHKKCDRTKNAI